MSVNTRLAMDSEGWLYPVHSIEGRLSGGSSSLDDGERAYLRQLGAKIDRDFPLSHRNEGKSDVILNSQSFRNAYQLDDALADMVKRGIPENQKFMDFGMKKDDSGFMMIKDHTKLELKMIKQTPEQKRETYDALVRLHGNDPELDTLVELLELQEFHSSKARR